jgi:CheY-like chemotaxis protein/signal transduction histidine kinase
MSFDTNPEWSSAVRGWDRLRRPVWMFDPVSLRGVYANAAALTLWGAESLEELLARDFSSLSAAVRARTDRLRDATAGGREVDERWTFYPNGRPVTVQATISTFLMDDGRGVLLFEAAPLDVGAEERRAVEALRHTSTLITLLDDAGAILFSNPAAYAAYGAGQGALGPRFVDPDRAAWFLAQARTGQAVSRLCEVETSAGRRWHDVNARLVSDPVTGASGVLLNEQDVTARVEAEGAQATAEQKTAMAEARQRFLTDMSHELRTPLNAVIGFSELLSGAGLAPAQGEQAKRIHQAGQRLLTVVNQMIDLSEQGEDPGPVPRITPDDEIPVASGPDPVAGPDDKPPLRVLCVDDNQTNRMLMTAMLVGQGMVCETAEDGAQGLAAVAAGDWDVVLMDIQMPVMDGVEATRRIRALGGEAGAVPIIAVTANTLADQVNAYAEAGMDDLVAKPVNMVELLGKVAHWGGCGWREALEGLPSDAEQPLDPHR